jgi:hypothetical protein
VNREEGDMLIFETKSFESDDAAPSFINFVPSTTKMLVISDNFLSIYDLGNCILNPDDCRQCSMTDSFDVSDDLSNLDLTTLYGGENNDRTQDYAWITYEGVLESIYYAYTHFSLLTDAFSR